MHRFARVKLALGSVARRMPRATRTAPVIASRRTPDRPASTPRRATATAYSVSHARRQRAEEEAEREHAANERRTVGANCGSRLAKKTAIFGFPRLLSTPCRNARHGRIGAPPNAAACSCGRRRSRPQRLGTEVDEVRGARELQRPEGRLGRAQEAHDARARGDRPDRLPERRRPPSRSAARPPASVLRIVSAVSGPGVQMTTADTARTRRGSRASPEVSPRGALTTSRCPAPALTGVDDDARAPLLLVAVVVWAGSFSVIKALLDDGVAAGDIAILRYAIAAPGFACILWRARGLPGLTRADAARAAAGLLVVVGYHMFLNIGTRYTTAGVAALVVALAPGLTLLSAFALGLDRISMSRRRARGRLRGVVVVVALGAGASLSLREHEGAAHRARRAARVRALQRHPEAAPRSARPARTDRRDEPRRDRRACALRARVDRRDRGRRDRVETRAPPVPRRARHAARLHPLERRTARPRADAGGDVHVRDLTACGA